MILTEKSLTSFVYDPPKDPELLLYDFYFLVGYIPTHEEDPTLRFVFQEALDTCTQNLQLEMKRVLKFATSAELRHVFGATRDLSSSIMDKSYEDTPAEEIQASEEADQRLPLRKRTKKFLIEYQQQVGKFTGSSLYYQANRADIKQKMAARPSVQMVAGEEGSGGRHDVYLNAYTALLATQKALKITNLQLSEILEDTFRNIAWGGSYGGKAWAGIAHAWGRLIEADTLQQRIIWIDHAYDLQHNTGSVFTKIKSYSKAGGLGWVQKALDWKKHNEDIRGFYEKVSPSLQYVVAYVGKKYYDVTLEARGADARKAEQKQLKHSILRYKELTSSLTSLEKVQDLVRDFSGGDKTVMDGFCLYDLVSTQEDGSEKPIVGIIAKIAATGSMRLYKMASYGEGLFEVSRRSGEKVYLGLYAPSKLTLLGRIPFLQKKDLATLEETSPVDLRSSEPLIQINSPQEAELARLLKIPSSTPLPSTFPAYIAPTLPHSILMHNGWGLPVQSAEQYLNRRMKEIGSGLLVGYTVLVSNTSINIGDIHYTPSSPTVSVHTIESIKDGYCTLSGLSDPVPCILVQEIEKKDAELVKAYTSITAAPKNLKLKWQQWKQSSSYDKKTNSDRHQDIKAFDLVFVSSQKQSGIVLGFDGTAVGNAWVAFPSSGGGDASSIEQALLETLFPNVSFRWTTRSYTYPDDVTLLHSNPIPLNAVLKKTGTEKPSGLIQQQDYVYLNLKAMKDHLSKGNRHHVVSTDMIYFAESVPLGIYRVVDSSGPRSYHRWNITPKGPSNKIYDLKPAEQFYWHESWLLKCYPIEAFETGKYYVWINPASSFSDGWDSGMKFMFDGLPHECTNTASDMRAAFADSLEPETLWSWFDISKFIVQVPDVIVERLLKKAGPTTPKASSLGDIPSEYYIPITKDTTAEILAALEKIFPELTWKSGAKPTGYFLNANGYLHIVDNRMTVTSKRASPGMTVIPGENILQLASKEESPTQPKWEINKWYKWVGPGKNNFPEYGEWNVDGKMDFIFDGKPHKIVDIDSVGISGQVRLKFDDPSSSFWIWYGADKYLQETNPPRTQQESTFRSFILEGQGKW